MNQKNSFNINLIKVTPLDYATIKEKYNILLY